MKKILSTILCFFCLTPNIILANQTDIAPATPTSQKEIVIETYEFDGSITDYETLIPNEVEHNGFIYTKTDTSIEEKTTTETLEVSENAEKIIEESQKETAISLFENELNYSKDNLTGVLNLVEDSLNISKNEISNVTNYETKKYTMYEDKTYYGLETNDYSLLPQSIMKDGVTLRLLTADFVKTNSVDTYNAVCRYGGTYTQKIPTTKEVVNNYKATVTYTGTVSREVVESRTVTVFYEKAEEMSSQNVIENFNNTNNNDTNEANSNVNNNQIFILFVSVLGMLFLLTLIIIFILTRQIKAERRKNNA